MGACFGGVSPPWSDVSVLQESKGKSMGPSYGPLSVLGVILGTLEGTYRVYSRYIRIPGLRAITRGP